MEIETVVNQVQTHRANRVTLTGGEPLAQRPARALLERLCDAGFAVSLETSGALDIANIDPRVRVVMDIKTPGSGEAARNLASNLQHLRRQDEIKFVLADRADYEWSRQMVDRERLTERCDVLFSPIWNQIDPAQIAGWILEDRLPVRLQVQLHKILWGEERGR